MSITNDTDRDESKGSVETLLEPCGDKTDKGLVDVPESDKPDTAAVSGADLAGDDALAAAVTDDVVDSPEADDSATKETPAVDSSSEKDDTACGGDEGDDTASSGADDESDAASDTSASTSEAETSVVARDDDGAPAAPKADGEPEDKVGPSDELGDDKAAAEACQEQRHETSSKLSPPSPPPQPRPVDGRTAKTSPNKRSRCSFADETTRTHGKSKDKGKDTCADPAAARTRAVTSTTSSLPSEHKKENWDPANKTFTVERHTKRMRPAVSAPKRTPLADITNRYLSPQLAGTIVVHGAHEPDRAVAHAPLHSATLASSQRAFPQLSTRQLPMVARDAVGRPPHPEKQVSVADKMSERSRFQRASPPSNVAARPGNKRMFSRLGKPQGPSESSIMMFR